MEMKTTMEIPDDLYRLAKTRAAAQNRKVRDLVTEGLEAVLARDASLPGRPESTEQVLLALEEILLCPASSAGRTADLQAEARKSRAEGWDRNDLP
jgi:hypothetical protein